MIIHTYFLFSQKVLLNQLRPQLRMPKLALRKGLTVKNTRTKPPTPCVSLEFASWFSTFVLVNQATSLLAPEKCLRHSALRHQFSPKPSTLCVPSASVAMKRSQFIAPYEDLKQKRSWKRASE